MENLVETVDEQARQKLVEYLEVHNLSQTAKMLGVNRGLIPYVLEGGHSPTVLKALDLPVYEQRPVPVCMDCGKVHTMHRTCAEKRPTQKRYRKSAELSSKEEVEALEEFAKHNGFENWTELCKKIAEFQQGKVPTVFKLSTPERRMDWPGWTSDWPGWSSS